MKRILLCVFALVAVNIFAAVENVDLSPKFGYVSFWFKPNFAADDGKDHLMLQIGGKENGMLLEKSANGLLRIRNVSSEKTAATRSKVDFKAGEWHHIAFSWFVNDEGVPCGLPLFFDKECVAGEVPGKDAFFDEGVAVRAGGAVGGGPAVLADNVRADRVAFEVIFDDRGGVGLSHGRAKQKRGG